VAAEKIPYFRKYAHFYLLLHISQSHNLKLLIALVDCHHRLSLFRTL
jgi:hypothetical protein